MIVCWPVLFLQYQIKAKMILHFFSGIVLSKSEIDVTHPSIRVPPWDTSGIVDIPSGNRFELFHLSQVSAIWR